VQKLKFQLRLIQITIVLNSDTHIYI